MNWGWKIAIAYIGFACMVVTMVVITSMKSVNLVEKDYYEKEINYQQQIDKIRNAVDIDDQVEVAFDQSNRLFNIKMDGYSGDEVNGTVHFFRPSDERLDVEQAIKLDASGKQIINLSSLEKGFWVAKLTWHIGDDSYFKRINVMIP